MAIKSIPIPNCPTTGPIINRHAKWNEVPAFSDEFEARRQTEPDVDQTVAHACEDQSRSSFHETHAISVWCGWWCEVACPTSNAFANAELIKPTIKIV